MSASPDLVPATTWIALPSSNGLRAGCIPAVHCIPWVAAGNASSTYEVLETPSKPSDAAQGAAAAGPDLGGTPRVTSPVSPGGAQELSVLRPRLWAGSGAGGSGGAAGATVPSR
jgi:hypothetical protein